MFSGCAAPRKVYGWSFSKLNYNNKSTGDSCSGYKTLSKVLLLYLKGKLQQETRLTHLEVKMP